MRGRNLPGTDLRLWSIAHSGDSAWLEGQSTSVLRRVNRLQVARRDDGDCAAWPGLAPDAIAISMSEILCLPGASGSREFWQPLCAAIADLGQPHIIGWPGLGGVPPRSDVQSFDDLVALVAAAATMPSHFFAQSMGGVVALRVAIEHPDIVSSLVLCATAGGLDFSSFGVTDWRLGADEWHPKGDPSWFLDNRQDLAEFLPQIQVPVLLLWGDRDPLSPVSIGERFQQLLPRATLQVISGGEHDFVNVHAAAVAEHIRNHLISLQSTST